MQECSFLKGALFIFTWLSYTSWGTTSSPSRAPFPSPPCQGSLLREVLTEVQCPLYPHPHLGPCSQLLRGLVGIGTGGLFSANQSSIYTCTLRIVRWRRMDHQGTLGPKAEDMRALDCLSQSFPLFGEGGEGSNPSHQLQIPGKKNIPLSRTRRQCLKQAHPLTCLPIPSWFCSEATSRQVSSLTSSFAQIAQRAELI